MIPYTDSSEPYFDSCEIGWNKAHHECENGYYHEKKRFS